MKKECDVGVVGQSTVPENPKKIVGVIALPTSVPPNVYSKELANIQSAIDNRINKKRRPFTATKEDKALIGEMVSESGGRNPQRGVFSPKKVIAWWEDKVFSDLKSKKWSPTRLNNIVTNLCQRIDPAFRLSCDVKLEAMPEEKAPRMLIADGDEGQVLSLLAICCMEDLLKTHFPKKTIKGKSKSDAIAMVGGELRAPTSAVGKVKAKLSRAAQEKLEQKPASVFEGDGSAWDTTCGPEVRSVCENPVIVHIASVLKAVMAEPHSWVDAHSNICEIEELSVTFHKNKEFARIILTAIRRSGHRGTSVPNFWDNFVIWHLVIFINPKAFLDPSVRYGEDHAGTWRWIASAFEGDDSILSTTPAILVGEEIHVSILQRWERFGYNMGIVVRDDRALFTGWVLALDSHGPIGLAMPDVDRCFCRGGVSASIAMIDYFNRDDRSRCISISKAFNICVYIYIH